MPTHLSENDIREKILTTNPISQDMKRAQKLNEYIKNLLFDNKKLSTLNLKKKPKKNEGYSRESNINLRTLDQTLEYHGSRRL